MSLRKQHSKHADTAESRHKIALVACAFTAGAIVGTLLRKSFWSNQYRDTNETDDDESNDKSTHYYFLSDRVNQYQSSLMETMSASLSSVKRSKLGKNHRLSVITHNVWTPEPLDTWLELNQKFNRVEYDRKKAFIEFYKLYSTMTDIFLLQECNHTIIKLLSNSVSTIKDNFTIVDSESVQEIQEKVRDKLLYHSSEMILVPASEVRQWYTFVMDQIKHIDSSRTDDTHHPSGSSSNAVSGEDSNEHDEFIVSSMDDSSSIRSSSSGSGGKKKKNSHGIDEDLLIRLALECGGRMEGSIHKVSDNRDEEINEMKHNLKPGTIIVYNHHLFNELESNCGKFGGAFFTYAVLRPIFTDDLPLLIVCSVHLTFPGNEHELKTGESPRVWELRSIMIVLRALISKYNQGIDMMDLSEFQKTHEPVVILGGDMNDHFHSANVAVFEYGMQHCFRDQNRVMPHTFPTPASYVIDDGPDPQSCITYDWLFHSTARMRGTYGSSTHANLIRAMSAQVLQYSYRGLYPSDHYPVQAVYQVSAASRVVL